MSADSYTLAGSDVSIPPLGVGTWAWGDRSTWGMGGYDTDLTLASIEEAWNASIDAGVTLFDTAEVYGGGESERIIGDMRRADPAHADRVVLATKFMPSPWKLNVRGALLRALRASLGRLGVGTVDLYQLHGPISLRSHAALAEALAAAKEAGLVRAVGVSIRSRKRSPLPPSSTSEVCGWRPTKSSSRCCGAPPKRRGCWPRALNSGSSLWPTRRSVRAASRASIRRRTRRPASGISPITL